MTLICSGYQDSPIIEDSRSELVRLQALPFESKVILTNAKIRQFYSIMGGKVYVSFSGGKDSTVLLDMVRRIYPEVPAVFCDTGLEFPEIREYVNTYDNVEIIKPEKSFKKIIEEYGYPIISKEIAQNIERARKGNPSSVIKFQRTDKGHYDYSRYAFLLDAPFKISGKCCDEMKKKPFKKYEKKTGRRPYIGSMAEESFIRKLQYEKQGCINSTLGIEKANPMSFWGSEDVYKYIAKYKIEIAKPYSMGYERTGCVYCLFGAQREKYPNRIQMLQRTHPKLYKYCLSEKGLNLKPICDFIGVETRDSNARLEDFSEGSK